MHKVRVLLMSLSFCVQLFADPLADSLADLGESFKVLAGFLPAAGPKPGEDPRFSVYKDFDYADPAPGVAQPKLRIGLDAATGDLVVRGPELATKTKVVSFVQDRELQAEEQRFMYPVRLATNMQWNAAGQVLDEGQKETYVIRKEGVIHPAVVSAESILMNAFKLWKHPKYLIDFNIEDRWVKSEAPKKEEPAPKAEEPKFAKAPLSFDLAPGKPGPAGVLPTGIKIGLGLVKAEDGSQDIVVWGPVLNEDAVPQDFIKDRHLVFPVQKSRVKWSGGTISDMGPLGVFVLVKGKDFAERKEAARSVIEEVEKIKAIFETQYAVVEKYVNSAVNPLNVGKTIVIKDVQDAAEQLIKFYKNAGDALIPLLSEKEFEHRYEPAMSNILEMASKANKLYGSFKKTLENQQKYYDQKVKAMNSAELNTEKTAADKGKDNNVFKLNALNGILSRIDAPAIESSLRKFKKKNHEASLLDIFYSLFTSENSADVKAAKEMWKRPEPPKSAEPGGDDSDDEGDWDPDAG